MRVVVLAGFLGSGKTTVALQLARAARAAGQRVGQTSEAPAIHTIAGASSLCLPNPVSTCCVRHYRRR